MKINTNKMVMLSLVLISHITVAKAECYIMGDSIAQGLAINRKDCSSETQVGLNSKKAKIFWLNKGILLKDKVIISLGVNDGSLNTTENLVFIRNNIKANQVIWILPPNKEKSSIVRNLATNYGDFVLDINSQLGKDNIHPTGKGYVNIAAHIKAFQYNEEANNVTKIASNKNQEYKVRYEFNPN